MLRTVKLLLFAADLREESISKTWQCYAKRAMRVAAQAGIAPDGVSWLAPADHRREEKRAPGGT